MIKRESIERAIAHLRMALEHLEDSEAEDDSPYNPAGIVRLIRKTSNNREVVLPKPRD